MKKEFVVDYFQADGCGVFSIRVEADTFVNAVLMANVYMSEKVGEDIIDTIQRVWVHRPDMVVTP